MKLFLFVVKKRRFLVHAGSKKEAAEMFRKQGLTTLGGQAFEEEAIVAEIKGSSVINSA